MKNSISKNVALSAFTGHLSRLVDVAGFCDQVLESDSQQMPYFDEADFTCLTGICQDLYRAVHEFNMLMAEIARYENKSNDNSAD